MNLVTDPWLPVTDTQYRLRYISLNQLFKQPDDWLDLVLRPHERVSVMRLLLCIAQTALNGGPTEDEWDKCKDEFPQETLTYMDLWRGSFHLFDPKKPFMQIADLKPFNKDPTPVTKLNFTLATGNASTLFDHSAVSATKDIPKRLINDSNLIVSMLSFNNFSLGGLYPQARWNEKSTAKSGVKDAPCASQSMIHCFVRKKTIIETLHANILTNEQIVDRYGENIGVPIWECYPSSPDDTKAIENATQTFMGRLVPLSRWLKILPDKKTILLGDGFVYPVYPEFTESTSVEIVFNNKGNQEHKILSGKTTAPWRELKAITTKRIADKNDIGGPAAIENQSESESYDIHILALKRERASILDSTESILHIPNYYSISEQCRAFYSAGVKKAEKKAGRLDRAIQDYLSLMLPDLHEILKKIDNKNKLNKKESEKYRALKNRVQAKYLTHYWTLIEKNRHLLMRLVSLIATDKDQEREKAKHAWQNAINNAATETYETLCGQENQRQIRAFVAGWRILHPSRHHRKEEA